MFDVKLTEIVRHCISEFKWLMMCDMIDIKKRKFFRKIYSISENSLCQVIVIRDNVLYSLYRPMHLYSPSRW